MKKILSEKLRSKTLWTLIFTQGYATYGLDLLAPIYAILVLDRIKGADVGTVGIASALSLIFMGVFRIPISKYMDRKKGLLDEFAFLLVTLPLLAMIPLTYLWIDKIWQVYLIQSVTGICWAMNYPAWSTLMMKKMSKNKTAYEWSLAMVFSSLKTASAALLAGLVVRYWDFNTLLIISPLIALPGIILIIKNRKLLLHHQ